MKQKLLLFIFLLSAFAFNAKATGDEPEKHKVTFTVEGADGQPPARVALNLISIPKLETITNGTITLNLPNGEYYYTIWSFSGFTSRFLKKFVVDGADVDVFHSFKNEEWNNLTINIEGDDLAYCSVQLKTNGGSVDGSYINFNVTNKEENVIKHEVNVPDGEYWYRIYANTDTRGYRPVVGMINTANSSTISARFDKDEYALVEFEYLNMPDGFTREDVNLSLNISTILHTGDDEGLYLTPDVYSYHAWDNIDRTMAVGSFEVTASERNKKVKIDLSEANLCDLVVKLENIDPMFENLNLTCSVYTTDGEPVASSKLQTGVDGLIFEPVKLPKAANYFIEIESGNYRDNLVVKADKTIFVNENMEVVFNFNELALLVVDMEEFVPNLRLQLSQNNINIRNTSFEKSIYYLYLAPDDYELMLMYGNVGFSCVASDIKEISPAAGSRNDITLSAYDKPLGVTLNLGVYDENEKKLEVDAKITVNGEEYILPKGSWTLMVHNIAESTIHYKVEAVGYKTYETSFEAQDRGKYSGTTSNIYLAHQSTGIESTALENIRLASSVVDNYIDLRNDGTQPWKAIVVNTDGQTLSIDDVRAQSSTSIGVGHLPAGHYILVLTDGRTKHSFRILKQ